MQSMYDPVGQVNARNSRLSKIPHPGATQPNPVSKTCAGCKWFSPAKTQGRDTFSDIRFAPAKSEERDAKSPSNIPTMDKPIRLNGLFDDPALKPFDPTVGRNHHF